MDYSLIVDIADTVLDYMVCLPMCDADITSAGELCGQYLMSESDIDQVRDLVSFKMDCAA
jgi:hypothetical protein